MIIITVGICSFIAGVIGATIYFELVESKGYWEQGYLQCQNDNFLKSCKTKSEVK